MVGGRRVTCDDTLEVMKMALPGIISSNVLAMLKKYKVPATSLNGISFIHASRRPPKKVSGSNNETIDFGNVGDITKVDLTLLNHILEKKIIPVISPISSDENGQILNINADTVASKIATTIKADKVVLITKIGAVYSNVNDPNSRLSLLSSKSAKEKIKDGIIIGGMIPKIEEGLKLFQHGIKSFHIVGIKTLDDVKNEILSPGSVGTVVTP